MITLHKDEKIIAKIRKHWLVFIIETFSLIVAAFVPLALLIVPTSFYAQILPLDNGSIAALLGFSILIWEFAIFIAFMVILTTYYLDIVLVTNERILDIDQIAIFSRDIAGLPIENIEDVKIKTSGILAEIFRFGSLDIQTAGEVKEVSVQGVHHPERARDIIMEAYHANKHKYS